MVGWSALCADCAAVLGLGSRRTTRFVRCALCAQTRAASQSTKRAARADPRPRLAGRAGPGGPAVRQAQTVHWTVCVRAHLLATPQIAPAGYRLPRSPPDVAFPANTTTAPAKARPGRRQRACGAPRSGSLVARARQRASSSDSLHVSERRERSERSELCNGATRPSTAGQSVRSTDRSAEALPPARARLCRAPNNKVGIGLRQWAEGGLQPTAWFTALPRERQT